MDVVILTDQCFFYFFLRVTENFILGPEFFSPFGRPRPPSLRVFSCDFSKGFVSPKFSQPEGRRSNYIRSLDNLRSRAADFFEFEDSL